MLGLLQEFEKIFAALSTLEAAAHCALKHVPSTTPGPVAVLPLRSISLLASIYKGVTGRVPGAGEGPFYRCVMSFRAAIDPTYKTKDENGDDRVDESMIGDIKKALQHWRRLPGALTR
jgi:hypothetical protein